MSIRSRRKTPQQRTLENSITAQSVQLATAEEDIQDVQTDVATLETSALELIDQINVPVTTVSTTEVVLGSIEVAGDKMGANGTIVVTSIWRGTTNSVTKRAKIYANGNLVQSNQLQTQTNLDMFFLPLLLWNKNNKGNQGGSNRFATQHVRQGEPETDLFFDSEQPITIEFRGDVSSATGSLTLRYARVEVFAKS